MRHLVSAEGPGVAATPDHAAQLPALMRTGSVHFPSSRLRLFLRWLWARRTRARGD